MALSIDPGIPTEPDATAMLASDSCGAQECRCSAVGGSLDLEDTIIRSNPHGGSISRTFGVWVSSVSCLEWRREGQFSSDERLRVLSARR